jgi:hypothetical protein
LPQFYFRKTIFEIFYFLRKGKNLTSILRNITFNAI